MYLTETALAAILILLGSFVEGFGFGLSLGTQLALHAQHPRAPDPGRSGGGAPDRGDARGLDRRGARDPRARLS